MDTFQQSDGPRGLRPEPLCAAGMDGEPGGSAICTGDVSAVGAEDAKFLFCTPLRGALINGN